VDVSLETVVQTFYQQEDMMIQELFVRSSLFCLSILEGLPDLGTL